MAGTEAGQTPKFGGIVRRHRKVSAVGIGVAALLVAAFVVKGGQILGPSCGSGRECVPEAGVSLVLPTGWHAQPTDYSSILFAAAPSSESSFGLMIRRGSAELAAPVPSDLDGVNAALVSTLGASSGFTGVVASSIDRVTLPIGPAIRARYSQTFSFIMIDNASVIDYWCFVGGKLIEIEYVDDYGENDAPQLTDVPPDVRSTLDSLRLLQGPSGP